jgi:hypothetical protein
MLRLNRVHVMVDKLVAQRDVEYFNDLLAKETDANRQAILLRLLEDAKRMRQAKEQEEKKSLVPRSLEVSVNRSQTSNVRRDILPPHRSRFDPIEGSNGNRY